MESIFCVIIAIVSMIAGAYRLATGANGEVVFIYIALGMSHLAMAKILRIEKMVKDELG